MNPLTKPTAETSPTMQDYPPPVRLKHSPIFMMPYAPFDGPHIGGASDTKYVSVGLAQWRSEKDPHAVSAKIWRYTGDKWSRMSEEIPLHRLADLCTFVVKTLYQVDADAKVVSIQKETFEKQSATLSLRRLAEVPVAFKDESQRIKVRLRRLRDELVAADLE